MKFNNFFYLQIEGRETTASFFVFSSDIHLNPFIFLQGNPAMTFLYNKYQVSK